MAKYQVYVSNDDIRIVFVEKDYKKTLKCLNKIISQIDRDGDSISQSLLSDFQREMEGDGDGGMIEVDNLEVVDFKINPVNGKGKLYVSYSWGRYFGCADINNSDDKDVTLDFHIKRKEKLMIVELFEAPERFDEF